MSKLQKSAWVNLGLVTVGLLIAMICFVFLSKINARGIDYIIISLVVVCIMAPFEYIHYKKKSYEAGFDEREKMISKQAFNISVFGLVVFLGLVCIIPFFVVGGGNTIKVIYLPIVFLGALFTAQFVHSMAIIIQCALEEENG